MKKHKFLILVFAILCGCANYGEKVSFTNLDVFYKDGATRVQAQKLGDWLISEGFTEDGGNKTVQLVKNGNTMVFRMVIKKGLENDEKLIDLMRGFCDSLSENVFNGQRVEINLCDKYFETLRTVVQL
ncbi:hypothetical protein [Emticicia sp. 17c]|uniref:hypothetical protein n=1 Tax=Emticicia sp. 17c TaxID=3127704 RepID=UPI00301D7BAE